MAIKKEPVTYTVKDNDTLMSIAEVFKVDWQRLWAKNTNLTNQDSLKVGEVIVIPEASEQIAPRELIQARLSVLNSASDNVAVAVSNAPYTANMYEPGQCVWYVKNKRPDLPNTLGNATDWFANAQRQGLSTGLNPRVGAVGWRYGHVVYIESVNGDGTVTYSDMNGNYVAFEIGRKTVSANSLKYIY